MEKFEPIPPIVFDTDCLSSFLCIDRCDLLSGLFSRHQMLVPAQVIEEFKNLQWTRLSYIYSRLLNQLQTNVIVRLDVPLSDKKVVTEFLRLTTSHRPVMGKGEAAGLAWVRFHGGTFASNNLKDVGTYCREHSVRLVTTEDILCACVGQAILKCSEASGIWDLMKNKGRNLPGYDFETALGRFRIVYTTR